jgi:hypothetical protein
MPVVPPSTRPEHAQGGADGLRVAPASGDRELVGGEPTRLVVAVEQAKAFGGPAAPPHVAWIVEQDQPKGLAHLAQLLDAPLGASGLDAHTGAVEPKPDKVDLVERELLREATPVDDARRLVRLALLQQRIRQEPNVVRPVEQPAVRDGVFDCLLQVGDRGAKIATLGLALAAPEQQMREVEDVAAPVGLGDRLVEDGNRFVEHPRPE